MKEYDSKTLSKITANGQFPEPVRDAIKLMFIRHEEDGRSLGEYAAVGGRGLGRYVTRDELLQLEKSLEGTDFELSDYALQAMAVQSGDLRFGAEAVAVHVQEDCIATDPLSAYRDYIEDPYHVLTLRPHKVSSGDCEVKIAVQDKTPCSIHIIGNKLAFRRFHDREIEDNESSTYLKFVVSGCGYVSYENRKPKGRLNGMPFDMALKILEAYKPFLLRVKGE